MRVVKLLITCIASLSILGFLGNDSIVLEAKLFRCIIAGAIAIYFLSSLYLDSHDVETSDNLDCANIDTEIDDTSTKIQPMSENNIRIQRITAVLQLADCIKKISEQVTFQKMEGQLTSTKDENQRRLIITTLVCQIKGIRKHNSFLKHPNSKENKAKVRLSLDSDFNEYYRSAFISVPTHEDDIQEQVEHFILNDDSKKPPSRLEYEKRWREAPPIEVYKDAYISRKATTFPSSYVVFDTETTGLEYPIERIIEIGAIKYINHTPVGKFQMLINPERELDDFITELTGIRNEDLINKPTVDLILPMFISFIEDYALVAHNAPFDIKMLACEAYRSEIELFSNKVIDTLTLARRCIPKVKVENYKLNTLKEYFGLSYDSHRALEDCEVCSAIYQYYCSCIDK
jgi:DNA polymerase III epsilon subunit family exonuclease